MNSFINRTVLQMTSAQFHLVQDNMPVNGFIRQSRVTFVSLQDLEDFQRKVLKGLDLSTTRAYVSYQAIIKKLDEIRGELGRIAYAQHEHDALLSRRVS